METAKEGIEEACRRLRSRGAKEILVVKSPTYCRFITFGMPFLAYPAADSYQYMLMLNNEVGGLLNPKGIEFDIFYNEEAAAEAIKNKIRRIRSYTRTWE